MTNDESAAVVPAAKVQLVDVRNFPDPQLLVRLDAPVVTELRQKRDALEQRGAGRASVRI